MELREFRCTNCRALLAKEDILYGHLEIKCQCNTLNTLRLTPELHEEESDMQRHYTEAKKSPLPVLEGLWPT